MVFLKISHSAVGIIRPSGDKLCSEEVKTMEKRGKQRQWPPLVSTLDGVERPIPADIYPELDTDLARDNLENDLPAADREDL